MNFPRAIITPVVYSVCVMYVHNNHVLRARLEAGNKDSESESESNSHSHAVWKAETYALN